MRGFRVFSLAALVCIAARAALAQYPTQDPVDCPANIAGSDGVCCHSDGECTLCPCSWCFGYPNATFVHLLPGTCPVSCAVTTGTTETTGTTGTTGSTTGCSAVTKGRNTEGNRSDRTLGVLLVQASAYTSAADMIAADMGGFFIGNGKEAILGVYTDVAGEPGTLLAKTEAFVVADGINSRPLNQTIFIASGTSCWLAVLGDAGPNNVTVSATQQAQALKSYENPPSFDMPETFVVDNTNPRLIHLFLDGCEGAGTEASLDGTADVKVVMMTSTDGLFTVAIVLAALAVVAAIAAFCV